MSAEPAPPGRSRSWLWFFVGLAVVAVALLGWLALFIQEQLQPGQQLKLEQLQAARKLWKEKGPADYDMLYKVKRGGTTGEDVYYVQVRKGVVQSVLLNGKEPLPPDKLEYHSMPGLFNSIEMFLKQDARPDAPRTFCRGLFSSDDGHLILFVRRVVGTPEGVEIDVKEFRPTPAK